MLDYAEKHYAKYFNAPEKWTGEPSLSSLEHYARTQKPAPRIGRRRSGSAATPPSRVQPDAPGVAA